MFPLVRITGDIALIWAQVTNYHVQCGQEKMFFKILPRFSEICKNMGGRGSHISVHLQIINTEACFLIRDIVVAKHFITVGDFSSL